MIHKKVILTLLILAACVTLGFAGKSITEVNKKYPPPSEVIHSQNELLTVPYNEGIFFKIKEARCLSQEEIERKLPETYKGMKEWVNGEFIIVTITVRIENTSEKEWIIQPFRESMLTIGEAYSNGLDLTATIEYSGDNMPIKIEAHESKDVLFVYTIIEDSFSEKTWLNLNEQDFYFVFRLYPMIDRVKLHFNNALAPIEA